MKEKSTVKFDIEAEPGEAQRFQLMILMLIEHGVFNVKNGSATLHFGPSGELGAIEVQMLKWRLRTNNQAKQPEQKKLA